VLYPIARTSLRQHSVKKRSRLIDRIMYALLDYDSVASNVVQGQGTPDKVRSLTGKVYISLLIDSVIAVMT
jgi:hypothetical protein